MRILDFGLARMAEAETLTAQGDVPGTLAYIAPERLAGRRRDRRGRRLGRRRDALGGALGPASVLAELDARDGARDRGRARRRSRRSVRTCRTPCSSSSTARSRSRRRRRPSAQELADRLRGSAAPRRVKRSRSGSTFAVPAEAGAGRRSRPRRGLRRLDRAARCRSSRTAGRSGLPPWPRRSTAFRERLGLAVALAVPILPLGNVSLGLAARLRRGRGRLARALVARAAQRPALRRRRRCSRRSPRSASCRSSSRASGRLPVARRRRAAAVLAAALAAGLRGVSLPLTGEPPPLGVGVAGSRDPLDVVGSLARAAAAHPALLAEAVAFALLAALLPLARPYGRWGAAAARRRDAAPDRPGRPCRGRRAARRGRLGDRDPARRAGRAAIRL